MYFIGRGSILIADRNTDGSPKAFSDVGEVPVFEFMVKTDFVDNFETKSPVSRQDLHCPVKQTGSGSMQLKEQTAEILALALFGTKTANAGSTLTNVVLPSGIVVGDIIQIPGAPVNLTGVSIHDSTPTTPLTLVAGTDYELDPVYGTIKFKNVSALVQPFKVSGTAGTSTDVAMLTKRSQEKVILFKGVNIADGDKPVLVQLHRVSTEPAQKITGKGQDVATYDIQFSMLDDPTKAEDAVLGRYGAYRLLA